MQGFARRLGARGVQVPAEFYSAARNLLGHDVVRDGGGARLTGDYPQRDAFNSCPKDIRANGAYGIF